MGIEGSRQLAGAPDPAPTTAPPDLTGTSRRRLFADRVARWVVTAGGLATIVSILGILAFVGIEVLPLFGGASVSPLATFEAGGPPVRAIRSDEYRTLAVTLDAEGEIRVLRLIDGEILSRDRWRLRESPEESITALADLPGRPVVGAATDAGRVLVSKIEWQVSFDEQTRREIAATVTQPTSFALDPNGRALRGFAVSLAPDGTGAVVGLLDDGSLRLVRREVSENLLSGEIEEAWSERTLDLPTPIIPETLLLDGDATNLYAATVDGRLCWWNLDGGSRPDLTVRTDAEVTALTLLVGDRSLIVGDAAGTVSVWFPVRQEEGDPELTRIRDLGKLDHAVRLLTPSMRNKGVFAIDSSGGASLFYSTSRRTLWSGKLPIDDPQSAYFTAKADGLLVAGGGQVSLLDVDNPHPEIGFRALFGKVWYEGYQEPAHVWQSTGGTDEFEPKLGLTPLMFGTLKGTLYSLILAIPLAVLGAMYTAHFMHPRLKRIVKPAVEIMAALPSVVLGFLAGLWLAPRIEGALPALLLMAVLLPLIVVLLGFAWDRLPLRFRQRFPTGAEILLYSAGLLAGGWLCISLAPGFETFFFDGDFRTWLLDSAGLPYDQRNAVVVGLVMGFAIIPIIFSIAEDALSNVPRNLVSGSLALGADRWQTVTRVVLPTASPGIFSAIMIGFGRAVGETMIVLMATGNTPLIEWNPFNGFRTMSANIAVEIPEAPHGGTLYRTLFLTALILFAFTFFLNTAAELIRQRLRRRYGET